MLLSAFRASPFPKIQILHCLVPVTTTGTKLTGGKKLCASDIISS
jgi:hypothetical protein